MMPNPADMLVFDAVAKHRSFTRAADSLGKTASAISQSVARLERDLNCKLLHRTTRSLALTDAGRRALAYFIDMRAAYDGVRADVYVNAGRLEGSLTVTAPHALSAPYVAPAVAGFCEQHGDVQIRLLADDAPLDAVERRIDLAIRVGMPASQQARITKIGDLPEALYAHRSYIEKEGGLPSCLNDIAGWDHIANEWQGSPVRLTTSEKDSIKVAPRYLCNSAHDVLSLVEAGAGVALLAHSMAHRSPAAADLAEIFMVSTAPIYAVHHFDKAVPANVSAFLNVLKEQFRTLRA